MDPRIVRTKQMLRDALIELIEEIGFERITVRDLAAKAGLNRGTFYLHYKDKHDLLEQSKHDLMHGLLQVADRNESDLLGMVQHQSLDEPYPFMVKIFEYFEEHADFLRILLGPKGDPSFPQQWKTFMMRHFYEQFELIQFNPDTMLVPQKYITSYMISANMGLMQEWLNSEKRLSPHDIALMLTRLTQLGPKLASGLK